MSKTWEGREDFRIEARRDEALERFADAEEAEHGPRCECGGYVLTAYGPTWCRGECET